MSGIKHKMTNYEVVPPAEMWDKIASSLDESELDNAFPAKLHNMQVNPPSAAWINIEAELTGAEAPVIPIKKKIAPWVKYAAAACLVGILAISFFQYYRLTRGNSRIDNATIATTNPGQSAIVPSTPVEQKNPATTITDEVSPENKSVTVQAEQPAPVHEQRGIHRAATVTSYADASDYAGNPLYAYADYTMPDLADRYIMLMTPEGNIIRMSKKLGNLVCCVSGEEQDADCKSQLKKWQEKLAASPAGPGNFLDIVNLVNSLDDNGTEL